PRLRGLEQAEHPVRVADHLVLHRPPQEQRDVDVAGVLVVLEQLANDGEGVPTWETLGCACELTANDRAPVVSCQLHDAGQQPPGDLAAIAQKSDGPRAVILMR